MDPHCLRILSLFLLAAVGHAAVSPQVLYWQSLFPGVPMPSAIRDHIASDALDDDKSTSVSVGSGGVHVGTGKSSGGGTTVDVGHGGVHVGAGGRPGGGGTTVNVGHGGVHVGTGKSGGGGTTVNVGHGGVHVGTGKNGRGGGTTVKVSPFLYAYAVNDTQIHDDPNVALFFLEKDLLPGTTMSLHWTKTTSNTAFLTQKEAEGIPFSSAKLPVILDYFSIKAGSSESEEMRKTLQECEVPSVRGEKKYCATSLETMVEFAASSLGTHNIVATSTVVSKAGTPRQMYTITDVKEMASDEVVACHAEAYVHAVFYCHATATTRAYTLGMIGADHTTVKPVALCHADTSAWNPNHVSFKVLNVQPGTVPICHFLPEDHIVWSRRG